MTRKNLHPEGRPYRVLWFGDLVTPSGFGRIGNEVTRRLATRGYQMQGASISYTGWPHDFPFHIWPLGGQDIWNGLVSIVNTYQPDIIVSCQDFPYHQTVWQGCRIDFSKIKWVWITPIDGTPVHPDWVTLADFADGKMVISRFGVEAMRQAGKRVELCHPGVDTTEFYPSDADERAELRAKVTWKADDPTSKQRLPLGKDDYVVGVMCMNQGRKAISAMVAAFGEFARDKPGARLYLDMDKTSPAGWDIPNLLKQLGWSDDEQERVLYKEDVFRADFAAFAPLRNRYALLDLHMVISHREGFGLPLLESQACKVATMALDWCSGTEICGQGRGYLVRRIDYMEHGSWGGAQDAFPDMADFATQLERAYTHADERAAIASAGYEWAIQQTWDVAASQVEATIAAALLRDRKVKPSHEPVITPNPAPGLSDTDGPAAGAANQPPANAVRGDPSIQRPSPVDPSAEIPGSDSSAGGSGGAVADPGAGRRQPRRKVGRVDRAAGGVPA